MSKKRRRKPFKAPSLVSEKYTEIKQKSESPDTVPTEGVLQGSESTDSSMVGRGVTKPLKKTFDFGELGSNFIKLIGFAGIIAIVIFCNNIKNDVDIIKTSVEEVKKGNDSATTERKDIYVILARMEERVQRFYDNIISAIHLNKNESKDSKQ